MKIYHFCCARDMKGIRTDGITKGVIPWFVGSTLHMMTGWQWLTLDGERAHQSWSTQYLLRYDRTEYRWTVEIPDRYLASLYDREGLVKLYPGTEALFDGWLHSEQWRVYHGPIPKRWLRKLERWDADLWDWVGIT